MSHLTDEQLEEIIQGDNSASEHLVECQLCKERLGEKRALADRLKLAFSKVEMAGQLEQRIRSVLGLNSRMSPEPKIKILNFRAHWKSISAIAAAAIILIVAVPVSMRLMAPALAAQAQLAQIHEHNMSGNHEFYSEADPAKLAEYFKGKLGFIPSMPTPGRGLALRGCCIRHFRGKVVGSYVVETPEGIVSVIVVTDTPKSMGMKRKDQTFWEGSFAKCEMVTVSLDGFSYCAVGEVSHEYLTDLLSQLLPDSPE